MQLTRDDHGDIAEIGVRVDVPFAHKTYVTPRGMHVAIPRHGGEGEGDQRGEKTEAKELSRLRYEHKLYQIVVGIDYISKLKTNRTA